MNDCYPEIIKSKEISYENFICGIEQRRYDAFCADSRQITVDTTDFSKINQEELFSQIVAWRKFCMADMHVHLKKGDDCSSFFV